MVLEVRYAVAVGCLAWRTSSSGGYQPHQYCERMVLDSPSADVVAAAIVHG